MIFLTVIIYTKRIIEIFDIKCLKYVIIMSKDKDNILKLREEVLKCGPLP